MVHMSSPQAPEDGHGGGDPPGDLRSVLVTSVLNLEPLDEDLFRLARCIWPPARTGTQVLPISTATTPVAFCSRPPGRRWALSLSGETLFLAAGLAAARAHFLSSPGLRSPSPWGPWPSGQMKW